MLPPVSASRVSAAAPLGRSPSRGRLPTTRSQFRCNEARSLFWCALQRRIFSARRHVDGSLRGDRDRQVAMLSRQTRQQIGGGGKLRPLSLDEPMISTVQRNVPTATTRRGLLLMAGGSHCRCGGPAVPATEQFDIIGFAFVASGPLRRNRRRARRIRTAIPGRNLIARAANAAYQSQVKRKRYDRRGRRIIVAPRRPPWPVPRGNRKPPRRPAECSGRGGVPPDNSQRNSRSWPTPRRRRPLPVPKSSGRIKNGIGDEPCLRSENSPARCRNRMCPPDIQS